MKDNNEADTSQVPEGDFNLDVEHKWMTTVEIQNIHNPVVDVRLADLKVVGDSPHRHDCPACHSGVLLMRRGADFSLLAEDNCLLCGQKFRYTDLAESGLV